MKKNLLIAAIALMAVAFVSCQKDGVYNPKHKIAKVYNEWTTTTVTTDESGSRTVTDVQNPYVAQEWTWGDKTLSSVMHKASDGKVYETISYTYDDKNRISGCSCGNEKAEYVYNDDKKLQSIKITDGPDYTMTIEITYDGKVPASVKTVSSYSFKNLSTFAKSVIPSYISEAIEAEQMHSKATVSSTYNSTIEWDGKNISQVVTTGENGYKYTTNYEYDNKANPFKGMYGSMAEAYQSDADYDVAYSKNNVVKKTVSRVNGNETRTVVTEYAYEYDGKMPSKITYTDENEETVLGVNYKTTYVHVTTYEYTK
jgi:hypothetical protein